MLPQKGKRCVPAYGQSFWIMLTSPEGMSAVKYGGMSGGISGIPPFGCRASAYALPFARFLRASWSKMDGIREMVSGLPHCKRYFMRYSTSNFLEHLDCNVEFFGTHSTNHISC